jgi:RND family efflux transporter MFP subunit
MTPSNGHPPFQLRTPPPPRDGAIRSPSPRPARRRRGSGWIWLALLVFVLVMVVAVIFVLLRKSQENAALKESTQKLALPTVLVVHPEKGSVNVHLVLPANVQPYIQSTVYAQVTGYLKRWLVDIGTPVKKGQLLAEIDTPELDQQLRGAQDAQAQNQASADLAKITASRYNQLLATHAVSQQDADQNNGNLAVAQANLNAAKANVARLQRTEAFKEVYAPFDGILTARKVDVGDLITAGTGSSSQALFQISQTDTLRVYTQVPEVYSEEMVFGLPAQIEMAANPGQAVTGTLVRTSKAIDPASLTLLVEVDVDNHDGRLFPGGYAQIRFELTLPHPPLVLPGNTLIFRAQGTQVGVVGPDNIVHLKDIKIGRDFGSRIEVEAGVTADDNVILNPSDSLTEGQKVQIDAKGSADSQKQTGGTGARGGGDSSSSKDQPKSS